MSIEEQLKNIFITYKINVLLHQFHNEVCSDIPNTFWDRKKHIIFLPYESDFDGKLIPTNARPTQLKKIYLNFYKKKFK